MNYFVRALQAPGFGNARSVGNLVTASVRKLALRHKIDPASDLTVLTSQDLAVTPPANRPPLGFVRPSEQQLAVGRGAPTSLTPLRWQICAEGGTVLRPTIDLTHNVLSGHERLLQWRAVFAGKCDAVTIEQVCGFGSLAGAS